MVCNFKDEINVIPENMLETTVFKCQVFSNSIGGNPSTFLCKTELFYTLT